MNKFKLPIESRMLELYNVDIRFYIMVQAIKFARENKLIKKVRIHKIKAPESIPVWETDLDYLVSAEVLNDLMYNVYTPDENYQRINLVDYKFQLHSVELRLMSLQLHADKLAPQLIPVAKHKSYKYPGEFTLGKAPLEVAQVIAVAGNDQSTKRLILDKKMIDILMVQDIDATYTLTSTKVYDKNHRIKHQVKPNGVIQDWEFSDINNRAVSYTNGDGYSYGVNLNEKGNLLGWYDNQGNFINVGVVDKNRINRITGVTFSTNDCMVKQSYDFWYDKNDAGKIIALRDDILGIVIAFTYNRLHRVTKITTTSYDGQIMDNRWVTSKAIKDGFDPFAILNPYRVASESTIKFIEYVYTDFDKFDNRCHPLNPRTPASIAVSVASIK